MDDQLLNTLLSLLFFLYYTVVVTVYWYLSWFRYPRFFALTVRYFRWWYGSFSRSKGFWPSWGRKFLLHWSYKWHVRIISTFGMFIVIAVVIVGVVFGIQNLLLLVGG